MRAGLRLARRQTRALRLGVRDYRRGPAPETDGVLLRQLVRAGTALGEGIRDVVADAWKRCLTDARFSATDYGPALHRTTRRVAEVLGLMARVANEAASQGAALDGVARLAELAVEADTAYEKLKRSWPLYDPAAAQHGAKRVEAGECLTPEEAARGLGLPHHP